MTNTFNSSTYIKIAMKCGAAASSIEMNTHLSRQTQTLVHIIYVSFKYIDRFVYMKNPFQYPFSRLLSIYIYIYLLILGVSSRTWLKLQHLDYICRRKKIWFCIWNIPLLNGVTCAMDAAKLQADSIKTPPRC